MLANWITWMEQAAARSAAKKSPQHWETGGSQYLLRFPQLLPPLPPTPSTNPPTHPPTLNSTRHWLVDCEIGDGGSSGDATDSRQYEPDTEVRTDRGRWRRSEESET